MATTSKRAQVAERRARVLRLRMLGLSLREIAAQTSHKTTASVATDLRRALKETKALLEQEAEFYVVLEMERLDSLERQVQGVLRSAGASDPGVALKAAGRLLQISQRRSALLGLDGAKRLAREPGPVDEIYDELAPYRLRRRGIPGG